MLRSKGKFVTSKQYSAKLIRRENGFKRRKYTSSLEESKENNVESETSSTQDPENANTSSAEKLLEQNEQIGATSQKDRPGEGRRIVELRLLGEQMGCRCCKEALSFDYIEDEVRRGLGSVFKIRCHKCLLVKEVATSKTHCIDKKGNKRYDVNSKSVLGTLHGGLGFAQLDKLFSCMNVPCYDFKTFKRYEDEIGHAAEGVAKTSCESAADAEKQMTIQNACNIEKFLPEGYQEGFIIHRRSSHSSDVENELKSDSDGDKVSFDDVVRLIVSYDMGWSTRGSGRSYDSLNGFGAIIGHFTGMVLDYSTCNRKCRKCDSADHHSDHDCRKNFYGSAKAMEPHVGKKLIVESEILKYQNVEVGVLVGDDDSSTIAACRNASDHRILKQSDKNHASGGVKKQLYGIQKNHKALKTEYINWYHRCFTYAVSQNIGNSTAMAAAIRSIPHHAFNDHSLCGTWCGYYQDPENYEHSTVPGGFTDPKLFEELKNFFDKLADNAEKFSFGASSNRNESLNAMMASKAPKSRCYSTTASADYRFSCVVGQKNLGETYTQEITEKVQLSPGKYHSRHIAKTDRILLRRRNSINTHQYKKRRSQIKKLRNSLRHQKESSEGLTYQSNCGLLTHSAVPAPTEEETDEIDVDEENIPIILFDLETSSLRRDCDILQIAAKCGTKEFSTYISPRQPISANATAVNGLINCNGNLMLHEKIVSSVPVQDALEYFFQWIESFGKKCGLAAHNLPFDGPRLFNAIIKYNLENEFSRLVHGFVDTLRVIKKSTGRKGKGQCTLSGLAESLNIVVFGAHNAVYDCPLLSKVLMALEIRNSSLVENLTLYDQQVDYWSNQDQNKENLSMLKPLEKIISPAIRKKLATAAISIQNLKSIFYINGADGVKDFFREKIKKKEMKLQVKTIEKIIDFLAKGD